jgi:5-methylcytosine-specific restriction protein B
LSEPKFKCEGIDLEKLLFSINVRIEKLLDKDYCIGHSYFMNIQDQKNPIDELRVIFQNKILPLLQEYFYGDWGKIMLVIGKEFVFKKTETLKFLASELTDEYEEYNDKLIYGFTDSQKWTLNSFKSIYE